MIMMNSDTLPVRIEFYNGIVSFLYDRRLSRKDLDISATVQMLKLHKVR